MRWRITNDKQRKYQKKKGGTLARCGHLGSGGGYEIGRRVAGGRFGGHSPRGPFGGPEGEDPFERKGLVCLTRLFSFLIRFPYKCQENGA